MKIYEIFWTNISLYREFKGTNLLSTDSWKFEVHQKSGFEESYYILLWTLKLVFFNLNYDDFRTTLKSSKKIIK